MDKHFRGHLTGERILLLEKPIGLEGLEGSAERGDGSKRERLGRPHNSAPFRRLRA